MRKFLLPLLILSLLLTACNASGKDGVIPYASIPAGKAYAAGKEIYFSHTEASDAALAEKLTNMMKSPVLHVPSLADAPESMLAKVYVFENGLGGKGPLGYQLDVFDNPPGTAGYSPLRRVVLVKWADAGKARELTSAADVLAAEKAGELTTSIPGAVVNMPFMAWDGGQR
ncbi:MAG TPA: hypothetical protein PKW33_12145 [Anaerolineaceae bacterium]|nr:hypothetical protein [Anaerolineaceae bacterium]HPN52332.1 hypothetical protein [Anaerolineaceae bacterium]